MKLLIGLDLTACYFIYEVVKTLIHCTKMLLSIMNIKIFVEAFAYSVQTHQMVK